MSHFLSMCGLEFLRRPSHTVEQHCRSDVNVSRAFSVLPEGDHMSADDKDGDNLRRPAKRRFKSLGFVRVMWIVLAISAAIAILIALGTVIPALNPISNKSHLDVIWKIATAFAVGAGTVLGWVVKNDAELELTYLRDDLGRAAKLDDVVAQFVSSSKLKELEIKWDQSARETQIIKEKVLELMQERARSTAQALAKVAYPVAEFNHAIAHIKNGTGSVDLEMLRRFYTMARESARKYDNLLGKDLSQTVHELTDLGARNLIVKVAPQTISALELATVPEHVLNHMKSRINSPVPLLQIDRIFDGLSDDLSMRYKKIILGHCSVCDDPKDRDAYTKAHQSFERLRNAIDRSTIELSQAVFSLSPTNQNLGVVNTVDVA